MYCQPYEANAVKGGQGWTHWLRITSTGQSVTHVVPGQKAGVKVVLFSVVNKARAMINASVESKLFLL